MATADFEIDSQGEGVRLRLVGDWTAAGLSNLRGRLGPRLRKELGDTPIAAVDLTDFGGHELKLSADSPDFALFAFTFGAYLKGS